MASRKSRTKQHRRDRRKAKQSGWRREPKQMGGHIGHGTSGAKTTVPTTKRKLSPHAAAPAPGAPLTFTLEGALKKP